MNKLIIPFLCLVLALSFGSCSHSRYVVKDKDTMHKTVKKTTTTTTNDKKKPQSESDKKYKTSSIEAKVGATQSGEVSYYADKYQGRTTASGQLYDKNKMTCAHRTLPFGTTIRVTRNDNGKSVDVVVNDRGPFVTGRIVDLSAVAAKKLDITKSGVAKVTIKIISLSKK